MVGYFRNIVNYCDILLCPFLLTYIRVQLTGVFEENNYG